VAFCLLGWQQRSALHSSSLLGQSLSPLAGYDLSQLRVFRAEQLFNEPLLQAPQLLWIEGAVDDDKSTKAVNAKWDLTFSSSLVILTIKQVSSVISGCDKP
jgi:hypothetical protein